MFHSKVVKEFQTHIVFNNFFPKIAQFVR